MQLYAHANVHQRVNVAGKTSARHTASDQPDWPFTCTTLLGVGTVGTVESGSAKLDSASMLEQSDSCHTAQWVDDAHVPRAICRAYLQTRRELFVHGDIADERLGFWCVDGAVCAHE